MFVSFNLSLAALSSKPTKDFVTFINFDLNYMYNTSRESKEDFLFNHNRNRQISSNLMMFQISNYLEKDDKFDWSIGLQYGTYSIDNYADEPKYLQFLNHAFISYFFDDERKYSIDLGLMPSHIGWESAISTNPTYTRSLAAENSPYFQTGAKFNYNYNKEWQFNFILVNGWQRITMREGNTLPGIGTQVTYNVDSKNLINWSTFMGRDSHDSLGNYRIFNNIYSKFEIFNSVQVITGVDIGMELNYFADGGAAIWYVPTLIVVYPTQEYDISDSQIIYFRLEYLSDNSSVITNTREGNPLNMFGVSLGTYYFGLNLELKYYRNRDPYFDFEGRGSELSRDNLRLIIGLGIFG